MQRFMRKHKKKFVVAVCILIAVAMLMGPMIGLLVWIFS